MSAVTFLVKQTLNVQREDLRTSDSIGDAAGLIGVVFVEQGVECSGTMGLDGRLIGDIAGLCGVVFVEQGVECSGTMGLDGRRIEDIAGLCGVVFAVTFS